FCNSFQNDDLYNLISSYEGKPLKLFVYNCLADNCREVTIIPNSYVPHCSNCLNYSLHIHLQLQQELGRLRKPWMRHWIRIFASYSYAEKRQRSIGYV